MRQTKQSDPMDNPLIVQFCHPGPEYQVKMRPGQTSTDVPWVIGPGGEKCGAGCGSLHRRRLISHMGTYVDKDNKQQRCKLSFWGEWEAETKAEIIDSAPRGDRRHAHWVHAVKSPLQAKGNNLLNTDPCVFGKTFKYCRCLQRKRNSLRHLPPGSLILFGSTIQGCFYLDTVFVVDGEGVPYDTATRGRLNVSQEYRDLTLERIDPGEHTFYRGRTFQSGEPYSFVPAKPFQKGNPQCGLRFQLNVEKINKLLSSCASGLIPDLGRFHHDIPVNRKTLQAVWKAILQQVRNADFLPAVRFNWPK